MTPLTPAAFVIIAALVMLVFFAGAGDRDAG